MKPAMMTLLLKHKFDLNNRSTYSHMQFIGDILLVLQLQHEILFKPITFHITFTYGRIFWTIFKWNCKLYFQLRFPHVVA